MGMDDFIFKKFLKAYEDNDEDLFNELNEEYDVGLESMEDILVAENIPTFDLSRFHDGLIYYKNYITSRLIMDIDTEVPKHMLDPDRFNIKSYSRVIYEILTALQTNPNLNEVMEYVDIDLPEDVALNFLTSKGLIIKTNFNEDNLEEMFKNHTVKELKEILRDLGLKTSGSKSELIRRIVDATGDKRSSSAIITDYGEYRLSGVQWVGLYNSYLDYFDFDDFESYMKYNDTGDVIQNSINYLGENLRIAYEDKDFRRLHDVFSSYALIYMGQQKFSKALDYELNILILRLNPAYKDNLNDYKPLSFVNIQNIDTLSILSNKDDLKAVFDKCWDNIELNDMLMSKDEAYSYLTRALDEEDLDELSCEISDKYY